MRSLISYFIKYPVAGNVVMVLILIFGLFGLKSLKKTFFPISESKIINIRVTYPGSSPEEIEEGVVQKIEENLKGVSGVERVSSVSKENIGTIRVEVLKEFDTDLIVQDVKNAVDQISSFPDGIEPPTIYKEEAVNKSLSFAFSGDVDLKALKSFARKAETDLLSVNGISKVELSGFPDEEIEIAFRENDLQAYEISFEQAALAVKRSNLEITGGTVKSETEELLIRARSKKYYAHELRDVVVKTTSDGKVVKLHEVANVEDKWSDSPNRTYVNGHPAVTVSLKNTNDEDIIFIADKAREYVADFNESNTAIKATIISDGSTTIRQRIDLLTNNGVVGFLLVLMFLTLFLNYRLAFWVAASIPVAFAGMFILASFFGLTINVMSLFGMILVIGILVDDGIVVAENIYQHWEKGEPPLKAAIEGTLEVLPAVISAVLTTVVAFSSFFFLDGRLGNFAPDMAFVVICTLVFSLVEGAIILPAHIGYSKALKRDAKLGPFDRFMKKIETRMNGVMSFLREKLYAPIYWKAINHKLTTITVFISLFLITIGGIGGGIIQLTFFPVIQSENVAIDLQLPAGTREHITQEILDKIEKASWEINEEFKTKREDGLGVILKIEKVIGPGTNTGKVNLRLLDNETRNMQSHIIANAIRDRVGGVPEAEKLSYGSNTPFGKPVSVALLGNNIDELEASKEDLKLELNKLSSLKDIIDNDQKGIREINIKLKEKAYLLGLNLQQVVGQVRQGFFGYEVQRLQRGEDEVKVWVRYAIEDRSSMGKLENMRIRLNNGSEIPLKEIATYDMERGVIAINHLDGKREIKVEADMADPNESATDINAEIETNILPSILAKYPTVSYSLEGQSKQSEKTGISAKKVMPIVGILMIALITLTFRSFPQAVAIVLTIPMGIIGVAWGHFFHDSAISLLSGFGVIALIGIMVNDSLVFVSALNILLKNGENFMDAIFKAGKSRFRPILLTSLTTIAGLTPLIFEKSMQAQFLIPMAIAVAYGLAIATLTTLFLLPVLLIITNDMRRGLGFLFNSVGTFSFNAEVPTAEEVEPANIEAKNQRQLEKENNEN